MARARNIKPAIMDNEDLADLEPLTRLLFIYLWMLADRDGRMEDRPKRIAAQALPYDRSADVEEMLRDLHKSGFINRYEAGGVAVIQISAFLKHQTPHGTEKDGVLPDENGMFTVNSRGKNGYATGDSSLINGDLTVKQQQANSALTVNQPLLNTLIPDSLIPDSLTTPIGVVALPKPRPSRKCPEGFSVNADLKAWAEENHPGVDLFVETGAFRDHTFKTAISDWEGAWRNWIRKAFGFMANNPRASPAAGRFPIQMQSITVPSEAAAETQRLLAEQAAHAAMVARERAERLAAKAATQGNAA